MKEIAFITEANDKVASGHLMETLVCAQICQSKGYQSTMWINHDVPQSLKERITVPVIEYDGEINESIQEFVACTNNLEPIVTVFNLREIKNEVLLAYRCAHQTTKLICVDEWGHRRLDCDVIVNPMIDPYYWDYPNTMAKRYYGAEYLVLFPELKKYHTLEKNIKIDIEKVVITMGGMDSHNHTQILVGMLTKIEGLTIDVVVGGGFKDIQQLHQLYDSYTNVNIYQNISFLYQLIYDADLVFCAGGNTLYEVAAIGTPAMIIPSAAHEERTAKNFEEKGFGIVCYRKELEEGHMMTKLKLIAEYELRKKMSCCGKDIVDGYGDTRMYQIITQ